MSDNWFNAALAEYRSLREESLQATDRLLRILGLGTTAPSVALGLGVQAGIRSTTATILLVVLCPVLARAVCVLGLGEIERIVHVTTHIAAVERRIAERTDRDNPPMNWETRLRFTPRLRSVVVYRSIFTVIFSLGTASAILGGVGLALRHAWLVFGFSVALDLALQLTLLRRLLSSELRLRELSGETLDKESRPFSARFWSMSK